MNMKYLSFTSGLRVTPNHSHIVVVFQVGLGDEGRLTSGSSLSSNNDIETKENLQYRAVSTSEWFEGAGLTSYLCTIQFYLL